MGDEACLRDPRQTLQRMHMLAGDLLNWVWRRTMTIDQVELADLAGVPAYGELAPPADAHFRPVRLPMNWPGTNRYAWLRLDVRCPDWPAADGPLFLRGTLSDANWNARNAQGIVLLDGRAIGGFDTAHHVVRLADAPRPGQVFRVLILVWTGMEANAGPARPFELAQLDLPGEQFALDFDAAAKTAAALDVEDYRRGQLLDACTRSAGLIDLSRPIGEGFYESLPRAHAAWRDAMDKIALPADRPTAALVGHGHLDLGWLWPVEASHFKTLNTVVNQLNLIDELDGHVFLWSQPQSWKWLGADHPPTWQRLMRAVRAGRWEASGAMWVEADTNITGGESLIRQLLYGTRFLREQLGQAETVLWLPDVFGYTAALPQLLRQFDIPYFMTTKMSWNELNRFPWETFFWQGLDGSRVLTHFGACRYQGTYITYNVKMSPQAIHDGWRDYRAKDFSHRFLVAFGHGDGGGGPTRREVQTGQRVGRMPGLPDVRFQRPREFFAELAEEAQRRPLPTWVGELYLEFHRGAYTTEGRTKRGNRLCEHMLHDAEMLAAIALPLGGPWDKPALDACWEKLLLNQFHDILPGSSIQLVYDQAEKDYAWILAEAGRLRAAAAARIAAHIDTSSAQRPMVLFNTLGSRRIDPVELPSLPAELSDRDVALRFGDGRRQPTQACTDPDGRTYRIAANSGIEPIGWTVVDVVEPGESGQCGQPGPGTLVKGAENTADSAALVATDRLMENSFWRIELDGEGRITRLLDKRADRDVLPRDAVSLALGNQLQLFRDRPTGSPAFGNPLHGLRL